MNNTKLMSMLLQKSSNEGSYALEVQYSGERLAGRFAVPWC